MKPKSNLALFLVVSLFIQLPLAPTEVSAFERIKSIKADKGKIEKVYMAPGLASVLTFPCDIDEAIIGRDQDLKATVSPTTKRQLTLFLTSSSSQSTNLLVRCGDRRDLFVFDIVVSRVSHQDELKIAMATGRPTSEEDSNFVEIESSSSNKKTANTRKPKRLVIDVTPKILIEERK